MPAAIIGTPGFVLPEAFPIMGVGVVALLFLNVGPRVPHVSVINRELEEASEAKDGTANRRSSRSRLS